MKRRAGLLLAISVLFSATGRPADSGHVRVIDDRAHAVTLIRPATRIVSLAPSITETVFALGLGERVVGVSTHCDYPAGTNDLPRIGGFGSPDIEKIVSLTPDLVLTTTVVQEPVRRRLVALNIPVYIVYPTSISHLLDSIRRLARLLGAEPQGEQLAATLERRIKTIESRSAGIEDGERVLVFLEIDSHPLFTATGTSFEGSLVRAAGGRNLAEDMNRDYLRIDPERVIAANPEVIITTHNRSTGEGVASRRGWSYVSAVRNDRVYTNIDADLLVRPGPRAIDGLEMLSSILYPTVADVSDTVAP